MVVKTNGGNQGGYRTYKLRPVVVLSADIPYADATIGDYVDYSSIIIDEPSPE